MPATSAPGNSAGDLRAAGADFAADSSTAANTVTVALTPAPAALYAGFAFAARIANTNTGPTAVNVNGLGPVNVMKGGTTPLSGGELPAGWIAAFRHDGTNLQLLNPVPATVAFIAPSIVTASGTVTIPANAKSAKVIVTGAGGGAGGTAIKWLTGLTPGNTFVATIGAAGTPSINGGASSLASGTQTIATITGSGGASGAADGNGGAGGAASGGDINLTGGDGAPGLNAVAAQGGSGGASHWGGGGSGGTQASGGLTGRAYGAGGGGGGVDGSTWAGADGATGIVVIEWHPF